MCLQSFPLPQNQRRDKYQSIWCILILLSVAIRDVSAQTTLLQTPGNLTITSHISRPEKSGKNGINGIKNERKTTNSLRPLDQTSALSFRSSPLSLAERFADITENSSYQMKNDHNHQFLEVIVNEEEQQRAQTESSENAKNADEDGKDSAEKSKKPTDLKFLWTSVAGSILLLGASNFITEGSIFPNADSAVWKDLMYSSKTALMINAIPLFLWIKGQLTGISSFSGEDLSVAVLALFHQPSVVGDFLLQNALPLIVVTIRKMLVAELWNRFFTKFFQQIGTFLQALGLTSSSPVASSSTSGFPAKAQKFVVTALQKGTKRLFQKALQTHLHEAIVTVSHFTVQALQEQVPLHKLQDAIATTVTTTMTTTTTTILFDANDDVTHSPSVLALAEDDVDDNEDTEYEDSENEDSQSDCDEDEEEKSGDDKSA